ncbi:MAG: D-glycero-beta-D-manno-heptose 1-phosphate adenylyltransferase [Bacteroidetes bacterium]|nr:MAG: D-glycero-beta-D-manno-heptose 1-phosphate adenylyltransferase [Bacteroidota bacterium]
MNRSDIITQKIISLEELPKKLAYWKFKNKKIVFTNGCFDILHLGHVDYLSKAAGYGDILVVGLNTDASVQRLKGPSRPVNDQTARARLMASLFFITAVVFFDEETPYELIKTIQPDVLVKGSDYKAEDIVGYDIVKEKGGEVVTIDFLEGYSTSGIIQKLRDIE